ncbi:hypothetical protein Purlil1_13579 [Purpureocillium lilacinum]|uniref:Uncharacterized protein n=1 Tax=Purpureocillium lilacinum TaxID=33203 RepID=A0ABR0BDR5_PURLI|nr:hypothetical protein Purlil1_13579 [Purpureocillium lilacinum]
MNPSWATFVTANRLDDQSTAADDMRVDCELQFDSSHLLEGSKMTVDDIAVAAAENGKVSAMFAPTSNATAADDSDMMRREKLEHIKSLEDAALEATRAYLQQSSLAMRASRRPSKRYWKGFKLLSALWMSLGPVPMSFLYTAASVAGEILARFVTSSSRIKRWHVRAGQTSTFLPASRCRHVASYRLLHAQEAAISDIMTDIIISHPIQKARGMYSYGLPQPSAEYFGAAITEKANELNTLASKQGATLANLLHLPAEVFRSEVGTAT